MLYEAAGCKGSITAQIHDAIPNEGGIARHPSCTALFLVPSDPLKKPEPWKLLGNAMSNSSLWLTEQMGNEEELE
ncbi:hypothetical protein WJX82_003563 [Trebouxia sp. C0006]